MADVVDQATRSRMMSRIRGKDTAPEWVVRKELHSRGFRYRLHAKGLSGRPDLVLSKHQAVIFIHGCFWHGHDCRLFRWPLTRAEFWRSKIEGNAERDAGAVQDLLGKGWRVATVWECALRCRGPKDLVFGRLVSWLTSDEKRLEIRE